MSSDCCEALTLPLCRLQNRRRVHTTERWTQFLFAEGWKLLRLFFTRAYVQEGMDAHEIALHSGHQDLILTRSAVVRDHLSETHDRFSQSNGLNARNEMTLASANSLHQRPDSLPT
jgi:hypothetical protein